MKKTLIRLGIIAALSPAVASAQDFYIGGSWAKLTLGFLTQKKLSY
ncbi:MAG: hypothetical protein V7731_05790 [Amphritea sp.]